MRADEKRSRPLARKLRRQMTQAEVILWSRLRRSAFAGHEFRRQHPVGPYIPDFASVKARLIIEVDGDTHATEEEIAHDRRRDAYLRKRGWRIFRVTNEDVYTRLNDVLDGIARLLPSPRPSAGPPPQAGEENAVPRPHPAFLPRSRGRC
jgi:very-short-patch-repair endonuclease